MTTGSGKAVGEIQLLCIDSFDPDEWACEGPATLSREPGGALIVRSPVGGATIWFKPRTFEGDLRFEWTARAVEFEGMNNLNFIFHARERDGRPVLDTSADRTGAYPEYHTFPNYIFTFVGPSAHEGHSRIRRNPGFEILSEDLGEKARFDQEYRFTLVARRGRLQVSINDRTVHDVVDPEPLPGGSFGIRTWKTNLRVDRLCVYRLGDGS